METFQRPGLPVSPSISLVFKDFDLADVATDPFIWSNFSSAFVQTWSLLNGRTTPVPLKAWIKADWEGNGITISLPEDPATLKAFLEKLRDVLLSYHETLKTSVVMINPGSQGEINLDVIRSLEE